MVSPRFGIGFTGFCRLVVTGNRKKVQCVVYTTTSFLFSLCCNSCFRDILIPSASDNQPAKSAVYVEDELSLHVARHEQHCLSAVKGISCDCTDSWPTSPARVIIVWCVV